MVERIKRFMEKWNMTEPGDRVLAGVSGGADSVCLCLILEELSAELQFSLEVVHVEHGIRGEESKKDAEFVRTLCGKLGLVFHEAAVHVPEYAKRHHMGDEEAARILRYREFSRLAQTLPGTKIALAHHMEDNAETMLLQWIRGSGLDGLCGMRPVRSGPQGEVYIRPLLEAGRTEIEAFLADRGQQFCQDSTNADLSYSRNRIRHQVIPELLRINPQAVKHMNRTAERLAEVRDYMDARTDAWEGQALSVGEDGVLLSVCELKRQPKALRMRLIHRAVSRGAGAGKDITCAHLEAVEQLLWKQTGRGVDLPYGLVARREYDTIVLKDAVENDAAPAALEITGQQLETWRREAGAGGIGIDLQGLHFTFRIFLFQGNMEEIPRKMYTKWFDYDMIKNGFWIRTREPGDYFVLDKAGHRKKIKDYFVNEKIPAGQRNQMLLLTQGAMVLWIVGGRMGYSARVSECTRMVLEISCQGGENHGR